jgi:hypothetical protein
MTTKFSPIVRRSFVVSKPQVHSEVELVKIEISSEVVIGKKIFTLFNNSHQKSSH